MKISEHANDIGSVDPTSGSRNNEGSTDAQHSEMKMLENPSIGQEAPFWRPDERSCRNQPGTHSAELPDSATRGMANETAATAALYATGVIRKLELQRTKAIVESKVANAPKQTSPFYRSNDEFPGEAEQKLQYHAVTLKARHFH
ncbi:hypothetical protein ELH24_09910 [Rhizobium ruizarguesonis]|uniref:hypothetical protein n=1 Tax=Rhizobium ruizarguesonis TaxID=2081791 RepID=UPI00102FD4FA|nr:hypothetical protein [Rhizobium ruizarguesonis]TBC98961.1 hypothetical protein ELH25_09865 [Rhizobium ruizarguesonis]TBD15811.1 hypothetical protein ELH24_09910 [Rhizobium ruizarguesonis]TBD27728.1 hypothetical protein ELH20_09195 [Rhizobium ruizarguesonis]TBE32903.1 hypothetical protein ELH07_09715 [Rhizobium ruizarguesonis]TBE96826.1 hypothetical protein ELG98_09665 [Rhizobium ruizarguesonis]